MKMRIETWSLHPTAWSTGLPTVIPNSWLFELFIELGMGWDILWVRCRHRSKDCSKAHHLPSQASPLWVGRVIPRNNLPHGHVCTDEFTQTGATRITILRFSEGSCSSPQKEEAAQVHRRRKLLESTEGGSCSSPQKEEAAWIHRRRKLLKSTEGGSCPSTQMEEALKPWCQDTWESIQNWGATSPSQPGSAWCKENRMQHQVHDVSNSRKQVEVPGSYKTPGLKRKIWSCQELGLHCRFIIWEWQTHLDKHWRKLLSPQKEEVARVHRRG